MTLRLPLGATVLPNGVEFRVWAPDQPSVHLEIEGRPVCALRKEDYGYWAVRVDAAQAGDLYRFRLGEAAYPDPYSRYQPRGPHGPSMIIDPGRYEWRDSFWRGLQARSQIYYELHVGTFTAEGTYEAAAKQLPRLGKLGVTCIEVMPVNEFVGDFGWGYDGVNWFAPYHNYGDVGQLKAFVDYAHKCGLGVILDVVYNHFGHDGNYLGHYSGAYFTNKVKNPWGAAPNYECPAMRRLAIDNAVYWIKEFHFDGLRLDAIQNIHDPAPPTLLRTLVEESRAAVTRPIVVTVEDYLQRAQLIGQGSAQSADVDQMWNDDFHHACRVALTGNHYGFFANYRGSAQEILSCLKRGFLYQGQYDAWGSSLRGSPVKDQSLCSFIAFLQNHDAVANTLDGRRLDSMASPGKYRALTAVLMLGPQTPLLFMGQEYGERTPFAFFADYPGEAVPLWQGRRTEAEQFLQFRDPRALHKLLNPCSIDTVRASTLKQEEQQPNEITRLFADLIGLRKRFAIDVVPSDVDGAVLGNQAFLLRWFDENGEDRLLLVNLGEQIELRSWPEPLLAAPADRHWVTLWSSEDPSYGGLGAIHVCTDRGWQLSAESAYFLTADKPSSANGSTRIEPSLRPETSLYNGNQ